jgi:hypothetical protein
VNNSRAQSLGLDGIVHDYGMIDGSEAPQRVTELDASNSTRAPQPPVDAWELELLGEDVWCPSQFSKPFADYFLSEPVGKLAYVFKLHVRAANSSI